MKLLGYAFFVLLIGIAALEIGGVAYAVMERTEIAQVYPWTLPFADGSRSPVNYRNAWLVTGAVPLLAAAFIALLVFMPARTENHGSARFARPGDMNRQRMFAKSGVILGKNGASSRARLIRQDEQTHTLLAAPTGAGKGTSVIIPNLLTYGGSIICVDVKGENWRLTGQARRTMGDSVFRFSPRALDGCSHRWNPLSYISKEEARRISELRVLATYLLPVTSSSSDSWVRGARNIFVGICLYVLDCEKEKTLGSVYRTIFGTVGSVDAIEAILKRDDIDPDCRSILQQYVNYAPDQRSGYIGSLEPLNLWSDPLVDAATSGDDFDLRTLRAKPTSIYLVVPPGEIDELAPLLRLFFQQAIDMLHANEPGEDEPYPVLMVMDEFRTLGKLERILSAITTIRSFGGRFLIVVQGLSNLVELYGREGQQNIIQNCGFQIFYTMSDQDSAQYVRNRLGQKTVKQTSKSFGAGRTPSRSYSETGRDLISVDEIGRLDPARSIVIVEGGYPVKAWRIEYFKESRFMDLVGEPILPPILKTRASLQRPKKDVQIKNPEKPAQDASGGKAGGSPSGETEPSGSPADASEQPRSQKVGKTVVTNAKENAGRADEPVRVSRPRSASNSTGKAPMDFEGHGPSTDTQALLDAREAELVEMQGLEDIPRGEESGESIHAAAAQEIERRVEATDGKNDPDGPFKIPSNIGLYEKAGAIMEQNRYPHVRARMDEITAAYVQAFRT